MTDEFVYGRGVGKSIIGKHSIEELCASLSFPRRAMVMVNAGAAADLDEVTGCQQSDT